MPLVLDSSVAACWAFDDEAHPTAAAALRRIQCEEAIVPSLWWFEIRNTLIINERRGRIRAADTSDFLRRLVRLTITIDRMPEETDVLDLARRHGLTVYDAAYLELARRASLPLATLDRSLTRAAKAERVTLVNSSM